MQFTYFPNRSTKDTIVTILHAVLKHLDKPKSYVRMLFLDFYSAFNTIQPHLLMQKLMKMDTNPRIIHWIFSFLINRLQWVRIKTDTGEKVSANVCTNTEDPQRCVLSPVLFTLYTLDC